LRGTRLQFLLALLLDVLGTAGVLLVGTCDWQTIVTPRSGQFLDDTLQVTGRTVDAAPTALSLVALAGAVAVIATRGVARRVVGVVIALAGIGIVWRAVAAMSAVSTSRARDLVRDKHPSAASTTAVPEISAHAGWAVLTMVCAVLVVAAGVLIALYGGRWTGMSTRYESPAVQHDPDAVAARRARADAAMWTALDRGDDPTDRDPREPG
jgi:uncharacterized membrane protein (TIGR02234 family)